MIASTVTPQTEGVTETVTPVRRAKERELLDLQTAHELILLHNEGIQQAIAEDDSHDIILCGGSLLTNESIRKVKDEDLDDVLGKIHKIKELQAKEFERLKAANDKRLKAWREKHPIASSEIH